MQTVKPQLYTRIKQSSGLKYIKVNTYCSRKAEKVMHLIIECSFAACVCGVVKGFGTQMEDVECGHDGCQTDGLQNRACFPIFVSPNDTDFGRLRRCLMFVRSQEAPNDNCLPGSTLLVSYSAASHARIGSGTFRIPPLYHGLRRFAHLVRRGASRRAKLTCNNITCNVAGITLICR